jgi:hypothetical protein
VSPADSSSNGGVPSSRLADVRHAGSGVVSAEPSPHDRRREATIEGLTVALGRLRRGAAALKAENPGTAGVVTMSSPDLQAGRGVGLQLLELVATRRGVSRSKSTTVWFEMARV